MIKFFRHIRQKLISENKFSKYLLYALGEIVLVVIGILIALQINNWNEQKKSEKLGISLLKDIRTEISLDTIDINWNLDYHLSTLTAEKQLLHALSNENYPLPDDFKFSNVLAPDALGVVHLSSMESLKSKGLEIISNKKLRKNVARLYDYYYYSYLKWQNESNLGKLYELKLPLFQKNFKIKSELDISNEMNPNSADASTVKYERSTLLPINFDQLRTNEEFKIVLSESIFLRTVLISYYEETLKRIRELMIEIEAELKKTDPSK